MSEKGVQTMVASIPSLIADLEDKVRLYYRRMIPLQKLEEWVEDVLCEYAGDPADPVEFTLAHITHLIHIFHEGGEIPNEDVLRGMLAETLRSAKFLK